MDSYKLKIIGYNLDRDCKWYEDYMGTGETIELLRSMSVPSHENMVFQSSFILTSVQPFSRAAFTDLSAALVYANSRSTSSCTTSIANIERSSISISTSALPAAKAGI